MSTVSTITCGDLVGSFLATGDLECLTYQHIQINQLRGNSLDGSLQNLYLRVLPSRAEDPIGYIPLMGITSPSTVSYAADGICYQGQAFEIAYTVTLRLSSQGAWFYTVTLESLQDDPQTVDLIFATDLGLSDPGAILSNEAYVCQYLDHQVTCDPTTGYQITSRQNMSQGGRFPAVQHGCFSKAEHFLTDGFDFYGLSYRATNLPQALLQPTLCDTVKQYEFALPTLQTAPMTLSQHHPVTTTFYGVITPDTPDGADPTALQQLAQQAFGTLPPLEVQPSTVSPKVVRTPWQTRCGTPLTLADLDRLHPEKILPEYETSDDTGLPLAYFTPDKSHVVLPAKELLVDRPHASIIQTGHDTLQQDHTLASTFYMTGVFGAQIVLGNTTFHKLTSNLRSHLNLPKHAGQRLWLKDGDTLQLLTLPSLFEMGVNYGRWLYQLEEDCLEIITYTVVEDPELHLSVRSHQNKSYAFYLTTQVVMGEQEYAAATMPPQILREGNDITLRPHPETLAAKTHPHWVMQMKVTADTDFDLLDDRIFYDHHTPQDPTMMVLGINASHFHVTLSGALDGNLPALAPRDFLTEKQRYHAFFDSFLQHFHLTESPFDHPEVPNLTVWWYLHNALIHYASPHGIEQYGGAAWGTRDVCQGPFELLLALGHETEARNLLLRVYQHQDPQTGDWPQWFMFDAYHNIHAGDSHGDIIVWPLLALSDYLLTTGDGSILSAPIKQIASETPAVSLLSLVKKQVQQIQHNTLFDTALSCYGNGDWNDTLQPANRDLKQQMISSWTVALTYQAFLQFGRAIASHDASYSQELLTFAHRIKDDFHAYLVADQVVCGFALMPTKQQIEYLIHPRDQKTGISYRLLPMQRAMIAELFSSEQVAHHHALMEQHLKFSDGMRLLDRPIQYHGGKTKYFQRGEQAANFGREVGILYVHANIRYLEAMAKIGDSKSAWETLATATPVDLKRRVAPAAYRQSNLYFSSSDADFNTRYEAEQHYDQLKTDSVAVRGGWRLYSSGPGIYIRQLLTNCLGVRQAGNQLILDPVLQAGQTIAFTKQYDGVMLSIRLSVTNHAADATLTLDGTPVPTQSATQNPYRTGGVLCDWGWIKSRCHTDGIHHLTGTLLR